MARLFSISTYLDKASYAYDIWLETFAEWDVGATTDEAILRADEASARAERRWDDLYGR